MDVSKCESCNGNLTIDEIAEAWRVCSGCYSTGIRKKRAAYGTAPKHTNGVRNRIFRAKYPHLTFYSTSRYLAGKAGVQSTLTKRDAYDIYHTPDICTYCGVSHEESGEKRKFSIDHVIPMIQGGPNSRWNLTKSCNSCNSSKDSNSLFDFYERTSEFTPDRFDRIVRTMSELSGFSVEYINKLLTQSHEFEKAHRRERERLLLLLGKHTSVAV